MCYNRHKGEKYMKNNRGVGLLGMLLAVVIMSVLLMLVLKQYTAQTRQMLNLPGVAQPQTPAQAAQGAKQPQAKPPCNGRWVGNICVPTEVRSASLDAFEQMNP